MLEADCLSVKLSVFFQNRPVGQRILNITDESEAESIRVSLPKRLVFWQITKP